MLKTIVDITIAGVCRLTPGIRTCSLGTCGKDRNAWVCTEKQNAWTEPHLDAACKRCEKMDFTQTDAEDMHDMIHELLIRFVKFDPEIYQCPVCGEKV